MTHGSEDIAGEIVKAIPAGAWEKLVATACSTFELSLAPLTASTSGIGRWITAKFDRLIDAEKINAAAALKMAKEKIEISGKPLNLKPNPKLIIACINGAAQETDEDLRELWANLLVNELTAGGVHPAIPKILHELTATMLERLTRCRRT